MRLHQTKTSLHSKGNLQQNEQATYRMGEISANHVSHTGQISKIYKELIQHKKQKKKKKKQMTGLKDEQKS